MYLISENVKFFHVYKSNVYLVTNDEIQQISFEEEDRSFKFALKRKIRISPTMDITFAKNRFQDDVIVWIGEGNLKVQILSVDFEFLHSVRLSEGSDLCDITVLSRDCFYYFIGTHVSTKKRECLVYAPDWRFFGRFEINDMEVRFPILVGKDLYYLSGENLRRLDTTTASLSTVQSFDFHPIFFTMQESKILVSSGDDVYVYAWHDSGTGNKQYEEVRLKSICNILVPHKAFSFIDFGKDFRHELSKLTECHVYTYFKDQMTSDEKWLVDILSEMYSNVRNEALDSLCTSIHKVQHICRFLPNQKCIFFGNDVYDIVQPPLMMFKSPYNYQFINYDMYSIIDKKSSRECDMNDKLINVMGLHIIPSHVFSGKFHLLMPNHAKGWHHNIENVPKGTCRVIYFVCTDVHRFGGSFFYYRHPVSHKIHAVPDVNCTMKLFHLKSDEENPLWHAIGSFDAKRLSMGFSKRSDMFVSV